MNSLKDKRSKILMISMIIILLDQFSKYIVYNMLNNNGSVTLFKGLLKLTLATNTGAAFSLFSDITPILTLTSLIVSFILLIIIFKFPPKSKLNILGLSFLLGGTIGNGLDRLLKGYVIDFIEFIPFNFPIFNLADIAINIAVLYYILDIIKSRETSAFNK